MEDVVELCPASPGVMTREEIIWRIRYLEDPRTILSEAREEGTPAHSAAAEFLLHQGLSCITAAAKGAKKSRKAWRSLSELLDAGARPVDFVNSYSRLLLGLGEAALKREPFCGLIYPLLPGEHERLEEAMVALRAERVRLQAGGPPRDVLLREEAREQQRRAEAAKRAERDRLAALERAAAMERMEKAAGEKATAIVALRGVKRHEAVVALKRSTAPVDRLAVKDIPLAIMDAATAWNDAKQQKAAAAAERKRQTLAKKGLKARLPKSKYMGITRSEAGFAVAFKPTDDLTGGSVTRAGDLRSLVQGCLQRALPGIKLTGGELASALFPLEAFESVKRAIADIEQKILAQADAMFTPWMVEEALGITTTVRRKWTDDGRLPVAATGHFRKWGKTLEYARYSAAFIRDLKAHPERIAQWRAADAQATAARRSAAAMRAVTTRRKNDEIRATKRRDIDSMAHDIAVSVGDLVAAPLVRLAIMTTMCSRWAKERQEKGDHEGKKEWYDLKDGALRIIARQKWTTISFAKAYRPRLDVDFCPLHLEEFRDERRAFQCTAIEFAEAHLTWLRKCGACFVSEDHDYYSLYDICLTLGDATFHWHVPYPTGSKWLPKSTSVPQLSQARDFDGETMYRYGRPVDDREMIVWPPKRLRKEIEALMAIFEAEVADAQRDVPSESEGDGADLAAAVAG